MLRLIALFGFLTVLPPLLAYAETPFQEAKVRIRIVEPKRGLIIDSQVHELPAALAVEPGLVCLFEHARHKLVILCGKPGTKEVLYSASVRCDLNDSKLMTIQGGKYVMEWSCVDEPEEV